jgi:type IV pilus assembly protein PilB
MSVLSATTQKQVEEDLIEQGLLNDQQIQDIHAQAEREGTPFLTALLASSLITEEDLTRTTAKVAKVPYVNLSDARIDAEVLALLPQDIAERYMAVPLGEMQHRLVVAMLDADNVQAADFLANKIGRPLKVYAASEVGIKRILKQNTERIDNRMMGDLKATADAVAGQDEADKKQAAKDNVQTIVQDSPISKALSTIMEYAAKNRASDIHIEPLEKALKIRARIDGVLREIMKLPKSTEAPLVSRIKILSNLKIDEHRIPQDGGFAIIVDNHPIDLRSNH